MKVCKSKKALLKTKLSREWSTILVIVINNLATKSREHKNLVFVSTRHVRYRETKLFNV